MRFERKSANKSIDSELKKKKKKRKKKKGTTEERERNHGRNPANTPLETLGEDWGPSGLAAGQYLITDNYRL